MSSSGSTASPVVCPLAKLGRGGVSRYPRPASCTSSILNTSIDSPLRANVFQTCASVNDDEEEDQQDHRRRRTHLHRHLNKEGDDDDDDDDDDADNGDDDEDEEEEEEVEEEDEEEDECIRKLRTSRVRRVDLDALDAADAYEYRYPHSGDDSGHFFRIEKHQQDTRFFDTSYKCHYSPGRNSPYLDQGYHTLVSASPSGWPMTTALPCISKCKKAQSKCNHFDGVADDILLRVFASLGANDLCTASRVCRRWYNVAWHPSLWRTITLSGERTCADAAVKCILRRLCSGGSTSIQVQSSGYCSNVKQVFVCDGAKITDRGLSLLSRRCPQLTHVQFHNCHTLTDSAVSEMVSRCPSIQHLDVTGCSLISSLNVIPSSVLPHKLLVQYLDLTDCISVQDSSLRIILHNCPQLTYLYLRRCIRITDAGVKCIASFCSSLRELSVSDCHLVTDFALYELAKLGANLRYLSVAKCGQVSDVGLKVIAKRCYKLRYLNVRGCEAVSDDALVAVARSCPRLRALDIGKCDVSDAGLKVLAENCPNLKKLSVRNCDLVTDRGVQFVCYYCRGLQQLNIQDCQITIEGYKAVKRFCKRCIIEHTNPGFF